MGLSSFKENRSVMEFPSDIRYLADHLGIPKFRVIGASGGGPYALACAHFLPADMLKATGVLYGMGPWEVGLKDTNWTQWLGWKLLPNSRWLLSSIYQIVLGKSAQNPDPTPFEDTLKKIFVDPLNDEEKMIMSRPDVWKAEVASMREAVRNGTVGYAEDALIIKRPWNFNLEDIDGRVLLWYGTADTHAPLRIGQYIADRLKNGKLRSFEGETHYTLMENYGSEILKELAEA
jgi:pimeloyl-ACP methyl ester carboxylesterase